MTILAIMLALVVSTTSPVSITFSPKYKNQEFTGLIRWFSPTEGFIGSLTEIEPHARNKELFYYIIYLETTNPFYNEYMYLKYLSITLNEERKRLGVREEDELDNDETEDILRGAFLPLVYSSQWHNIFRNAKYIIFHVMHIRCCVAWQESLVDRFGDGWFSCKEKARHLTNIKLV